jgi:Na+-translocating ferredoxin:NAD+ oxidoreductase subunit D
MVQWPANDLGSQADESQALSPQAAPYLRARLRVGELNAALVAAALGLLLVGWVFYGPRVLLLAVAGLGTAALTEGLCGWAAGRHSSGGLVHSLAMGLLVVLMLPAGSTWYAGLAAVVVAVVIAVAVGKWLMGGLGHYPWHPAVVGVVVLFMLWPEAVTPQYWPLLGRGYVLAGNGFDLSGLEDVPVVLDWAQAVPAHQAIGFALPRAERALHRAAIGLPPTPGSQEPVASAVGRGTDAAIVPAGPVVTTVRDLLPSAWDMITGATAAPIGQGSTLMLIAAGFLLIWRGYLVWAVPLGGLAGAFAAAAILPAGEAGWLPIRYVAAGEPIGWIWTGCQVLLGSTLFAVILLAGETVTSPMTRRGQAVYGFGVGMLTVALRWTPVALLAGCWAVLAMNTVVPLIDWSDRRWRLLRGR